MAKVLTTDSILQCGHGGTVKTTSTAKLKIDGKPVLILGSIEPTVSDCPLVDNTSTGTLQCKTATITGGEARKLHVDGLSVMLDTVSITTTGTPVSVPIVTAKQTKLTAS